MNRMSRAEGTFLEAERVYLLYAASTSVRADRFVFGTAPPVAGQTDARPSSPPSVITSFEICLHFGLQCLKNG